MYPSPEQLSTLQKVQSSVVVCRAMQSRPRRLLFNNQTGEGGWRKAPVFSMLRLSTKVLHDCGSWP